MRGTAAVRARIRVLPDHVANQIAAGEVVERPASVVKELVENALDAGARTVRVSIERGGKGRIRVSDDGSGMTREDALVCLDRHATSKIRRADELREIHTLGFRGEALPSIAAVSRLTIETAVEGEPVGTRIRAVAGRMQGVEDAARRPGTTVDVGNLFLNTPVRARFLANVAAETRAVGEVIHSQALAHQDVRFVFESGGRTVLDLPAGRGLGPRVEAIWEDAGRAGLIDLATKKGDLCLTGAIQRPDLARPGFRRSHLFVNGRPFRDGGLIAAADRGYRTTVPEAARPWLFLFLGMPRVEVDVNVHPGKAEVRFQNRRAIEDFVEAAVRETLEGIESAATWGAARGAVREGTGTPGDESGAQAGGAAAAGGAVGDPGDGPPADAPTGTGADAPADTAAAQMQLFRSAARDNGERADEQEPGQRAPGPALLQVHNSFILAETRDGVIIVDQHAAHERVLYERIIAGFEQADGQGQRLLFPFTIRLTEPELDVVETVRAPLARLGFEFERFGDGALLVHAVPSPHAYFDAERCMREMVDELVHGSDLLNSARNQNERVAMSFACKAAIKAGQRLSDEEMQELFDQLFATELPYHDIHGRPTTVSLRLDELRRSFGRS